MMNDAENVFTSRKYFLISPGIIRYDLGTSLLGQQILNRAIKQFYVICHSVVVSCTFVFSLKERFDVWVYVLIK